MKKFKIQDKHLRPVLVALIVLVAGPEIFAAAEMLTLLELFGAANFIALYLYAFKSLALRPAAAMLRFMRRTELLFPFIPTWRTTTQMPGMLMHAMPLHTISFAFVLLFSGFIAWDAFQLLQAAR